jgi:hypothetical protein
MDPSGDTSQAALGGCLCGAVRYRVSGAPSNSMICHCQTCRRAAGAPVVAWLTFPKSSFHVLKGEADAYRSSEYVRRTFCPGCGTPLTYEHADSPKSIDLTTCSLDDPQAFPPTHHSWLSHDLAWVRFGDGLPAFQEWRPKE